MIPVDEYTEIRYVSMRVEDESSFYDGLKLLGPDKETIFDVIWSYSGSWSSLYEVPVGTQIVGIKCDTTTHEHLIRRFSFQLGLIGEPKLAGEIRFPIMETYPSFIQFKTKYLETLGNFPKLDRVIYKTMAGLFELSGIQLLFEDGSQSHMIDITGRDTRYFFEIDQSRDIRWLSMLVVWDDHFEGIRLYDEDMDLIVDKIWHDSPFGIWSEVQEIPKGQHIIGVKVNTIENDLITDLTFILSPRPVEPNEAEEQ